MALVSDSGNLTLPSERMATGSNGSSFLREEMAWSLSSQLVPSPLPGLQGPTSSLGVTVELQMH